MIIFFTNRIKITSKWTANYGTTASVLGKRAGAEIQDKANFDGKM